jgi:hypothetical protein
VKGRRVRVKEREGRKVFFLLVLKKVKEKTHTKTNKVHAQTDTQDKHYEYIHR